LYREKGIQSLLDVYRELRPTCNLPLLNIIGKGPDYDIINQWIQANDMQDLIVLRGTIYDINEKAKYFARALACISPKQAGLTVLESMGYGVPFISTKNAITGVELFNVHNGVDGVVMESEGELSSVVRDIAENPDKYIAMGEKAKEFYDKNRTPKHMAQGFWEAIQYVINHK
jgi:glycosyltransferase involved in cell wall biosynthesis